LLNQENRATIRIVIIITGGRLKKVRLHSDLVFLIRMAAAGPLMKLPILITCISSLKNNLT